mmetsp:Transcript_27348/g.85054  ORF Transcript_27348/g.85054 Transcript_27348/m.85054 type:complete len:279 (-) Transcript_27348:374-1210(-)
MDFTLGGPNFCFLLGGVFLFVGIFMPLVRRANGIDPGLSNAPTVVYFFRKGWGFHGERIDVSYDCAQIGVLFFMVGASQVNYPHGYVWTTALVIYLWPFIAFVFVVVRLAGLRTRSPPDEAAGTFGDLYEKGTWELSRISRRWERQDDYVVRVNSVYADRTVPVSTARAASKRARRLIATRHQTVFVSPNSVALLGQPSSSKFLYPRSSRFACIYTSSPIRGGTLVKRACSEFSACCSRPCFSSWQLSRLRPCRRSTIWDFSLGSRLTTTLPRSTRSP